LAAQGGVEGAHVPGEEAGVGGVRPDRFLRELSDALGLDWESDGGGFVVFSAGASRKKHKSNHVQPMSKALFWGLKDNHDEAPGTNCKDTPLMQ
jgi:hypothetical protein